MQDHFSVCSTERLASGVENKMPDIWINAFIMIKENPTDEELKAIGKLVLNALRQQWDENNSLDAPTDKYGCKPYTEITVGTS